MKVSRKDVAIATANGISRKTLNKRLSRGWNIKRAISQPLKRNPTIVRNPDGTFATTVRDDRRRQFTIPEYWDNKLQELAAEEYLSLSDYVREVVLEHLSQKLDIPLKE